MAGLIYIHRNRLESNATSVSGIVTNEAAIVGLNTSPDFNAVIDELKKNRKIMEKKNKKNC